MQLEYFHMIDRIVDLKVDEDTGCVTVGRYGRVQALAPHTHLGTGLFIAPHVIIVIQQSFLD